MEIEPQSLFFDFTINWSTLIRALTDFTFFSFFFFLIFDGSCKICKNLYSYLTIKIELMKCNFVISLTFCKFRGHLGAFGALSDTWPKFDYLKIIFVNSYCGKTVRARKKLCEVKILQNYLSYLLKQTELKNMQK